jgi:hypothetical protein
VEVLLGVLPGSALVAYAIWRMPPSQQRPPAPWLPPAKIEDGRGFAPRRPPAPPSARAGMAQLVLGLLLMFVGGCAGFIVRM